MLLPSWVPSGVVLGVKLGSGWGHVGSEIDSATAPGGRSESTLKLDAFQNRFGINFEPIWGSKIITKSLPNGLQEPPNALSLPDAVSRPVFASMSTPRNLKNIDFYCLFQKSCFPHRDPKKHPKMSSTGSPKATQEASGASKFNRKRDPGFKLDVRHILERFWEPKLDPKWAQQSLNNLSWVPRAP